MKFEICKLSYAIKTLGAFLAFRWWPMHRKNLE